MRTETFKTVHKLQLVLCEIEKECSGVGSGRSHYTPPNGNELHPLVKMHFLIEYHHFLVW